MEQLIRYFEEISKIPRCSGNEKAISDYLVQFAKMNNLEATQDEVYNTIIKKPASLGYENAPTVILQGHLDMVCVKTKEKVHDFTKDPITFRYRGDMIYGDDTTLGADNGIAIAYAMAIMTSKDIKHPSLEILLTSSEEYNMVGAYKVNPESLSGKTLICLDVSEGGKLYVGCAGAIKTTTTLKTDWQMPQCGWEAFKVDVKGLKGGHSGNDINKGRGNAIKLMGRVLNGLSKEMDFRISQINGGIQNSAIPVGAEAVILSPAGKYPELLKIIEEWDVVFKNELKNTDDGVFVSIVQTDNLYDRVLCSKDTEKVLQILMSIPNGVQTLDTSFIGKPQSSTNLGVIATTEEGVEFGTLIRSAVETLKEYIREQSYTIAKLVGADYYEYAEVKAWEYNPDSRILEICQNIYKEETGKEAEITVAHGTNECALFGEKINNLDMVAFGCDTYECHSVNEHVSMSSMKNAYIYLLKVLEALS